MLTVSQQILAQIGLFAAFLLILSSGHKWLQPARTRVAVQKLASLPLRFAKGVVVVVSLLEFCAGVLLVVPVTRYAGAALALLIWSVYFLLIARAWAAGRRDVDCGCSFGSLHQPLGAFPLLRNVSLVAIGLALVLGPTDVSDLLSPSKILAGLALLALYAALDQVMALRPIRRAGEAI